ncbi:MAG: DUF1343 domain-containing protein [Chitinophagaceae bacterium]|nr:DUF1343 domain-containing protein [Chitinophagaceae bacterium]
MKDLLHSIKKSESVGFFGNHTAWSFRRGDYTFSLLRKTKKLKRIFIPEHGLFGELQDQVTLDDTSLYRHFLSDIECVSLYTSRHPERTPQEEHLKDLDTLVVDIQDVGCRYYTFITSLYLLLKKITELKRDITVIINDKPNPAGRQVEGTLLSKAYSSFIGWEGLPHRHGLTLGELTLIFKHQLQAKWKLKIVPANEKNYTFIPPSPNIPNRETCNVYSGQCLWEGTNISEGRGTTLPFRMIGAPFLSRVFNDNWNHKSHPAYHPNCSIKPICFTPCFHKYAGTLCYGLHLIPENKKPYHSLLHSLRLIRYVKEMTAEFSWRKGNYEAFNDKTAIELLAGDDLILSYLNGFAGYKEVKEKMTEHEKQWIAFAKNFLLYKTKLKTING